MLTGFDDCPPEGGVARREEMVLFDLPGGKQWRKQEGALRFSTSLPPTSLNLLC